MGTTLSVCIVTQNQASLLRGALENVATIADEIVVVDGGSQDETREVACGFSNARWVARPFDTITTQKNFAISQARCDWVFLLDTDERLGDDLRAGLPRLLRHCRRRWYKFPRYWLVSESPCRYVRTEMLYPDWQLRLFRNDPFWRYLEDRPVHHRFPRTGRGPGKKVHGQHIFHLDFLLNDRPSREAKVSRYNRTDPAAARTNAMYLYEDVPHEIVDCAERWPEEQRNARRREPSVPR